MKRLSYIYYAAPLTVALNTLPGMLDNLWRVVAAVVLGVGVWTVTWLRLYTNKKLRPEFAVLAMLPALIFNILCSSGEEYTAVFHTPGWQNLNFFLWFGAVFVSIRTFLPAAAEYKGRLSTDSVFIFMTIITCIYGFSCWMNTHIYLTSLN